MATRAQAARANIKKAQNTWRPMSSRACATAQPEGRGRAKPGLPVGASTTISRSGPGSEFSTFRTQDVGRQGRH